MGPLLFLPYVNDRPQYVQNQNRTIFADDTMIYSVGSNAADISSKLQEFPLHNYALVHVKQA